MADNNGLFFNSINGDRVYNADSFAEWLQKFFTTGVFNGEMQVTPGSGMMINVAPGYANINGKVRFFDTMQAFTIDPASGTYPRIDAIMVRLDETARNISAVYVKGDYSGDSPTAPAPVRSEGVYDIVLAHIAVNAGQTAITAANITDTRADDEICGWVTSTVEGVPMDQIVSQMQADFLAWYDHMKDQLDEDAAGHLQQEIDTLTSAVSSINTEIGDTDISDIGDGTLTGAVSALNNSLMNLNDLIICREIVAINTTLSATYIEAVSDVSYEGYTPISLGYRLNQVSFTVYRADIDSDQKAHIGLYRNGSQLGSTILTLTVYYIKNSALYH